MYEEFFNLTCWGMGTCCLVWPYSKLFKCSMFVSHSFMSFLIDKKYLFFFRLHYRQALAEKVEGGEERLMTQNIIAYYHLIVIVLLCLWRAPDTLVFSDIFAGSWTLCALIDPNASNLTEFSLSSRTMTHKEAFRSEEVEWISGSHCLLKNFSKNIKCEDFLRFLV